ncbi:MAG: hypothetical protein LBI18_03595 [Planctomycetaceae bacterium]|jgi:L-arabinose isomerase|nr:hypothetical protein [Planctomycetaceae bacterium]
MKISVFFIGRKRPGFEPAWGALLEKKIQVQLESSPFQVSFFSPITDEQEMKNAIVQSRNNGAEIIIVSQPTMGDGNLCPILSTEWSGAVIVWATPENPANPDVSACGLVGAHNWISAMSQLGFPPYLVYGMPGTSETIKELNDTIWTASASVRLAHARVGLIGDHAPGFLNMAVDAVATQRQLGARLKRFGLHEFYTLVRSISEQEVQEDCKRAKALNLPVKQGVVFDESVWNISSRYYLAIQKLVQEEKLNAVALRCWPEMPNEFGVWSYLAVPRLANDGIAICEEGDVDGALGCLVAQSMGCPSSAFNSDWLEHNDNSILLWHGGATPFDMCEPIGSSVGPTLNVHYNTKKPIVVDTELKHGMLVTLFRFWRFENRYSMAIVEGTMDKPPRTITGCAGLVRVSGSGVKRFFEDICTLGMPHHMVVMQGHYGTMLRRFAERHRPAKLTIVRSLGIQ